MENKGTITLLKTDHVWYCFKKYPTIHLYFLFPNINFYFPERAFRMICVYVNERTQRNKMRERKNKNKDKLHPTNPNGFSLIPILGTLTAHGKTYRLNLWTQRSLEHRLGTVSFFLSFFQSMKQICALDIASCCFQSTIMTVVHAFPIAVRNQIVSVSGALQQFDIVPTGEHGQIVIFLGRIKQGYVCAAHSTWLSVWLSYSTFLFFLFF